MKSKRKELPMIKREYKTKDECVGLFVDECFDAIPSWVVTDAADWYEHWTFRSCLDEDGGDYDGEEYGYTHEPMWHTWFIPSNPFNYLFIEKHEEEVMDMGFTLIYHDDELFAIGVDGCGYSFCDTLFNTLFTPLYDAQGLHWHD